VELTELEKLQQEFETSTNYIRSLADKDPEQLTDEEVEKAEKTKARLDELPPLIKRHQIKKAAVDARKPSTYKRSEEFGAGFGVKVKNPVSRRDVSDALKAWMFNGHPRVNIKDSWKRSADAIECDYQLGEQFICGENIYSQYIRDQSTDTTTEGVETLSGNVFQSVVEARKFVGSIIEVCDVINDPLENGNTGITFATMDDTSTGVRYPTTQNQATQDDPSVFGTSVTLGYKIATTKSYPISIQVALNPNTDMLGLINRNQGKRLRREIVRVATIGAGGLEGTGIVSGIIQGGSSVTSGHVVPGVVNDLYYAVDPEYRNTPNSAFIVHDNSVSDMETYLVNTAGFPMWSMDLINGPGAKLKGERFLRNNYLDQFAVGGADKKWMLYGDFSFMKVRFIGSPQVIVDRSRFADTFSIFAGMWMGYDCKFVEPGNNPVKYSLST
jgi:HK97 family phage major capsid protein